MNKVVCFEDLMPEIEKEIQGLIKLLDEYIFDIPITDLVTMAYGKVLEVSTKYPIIISKDNKDKAGKLDFTPLFEEARDFIFKEVVKEFFRRYNNIEQESSILFLTKILYRGTLPYAELVKAIIIKVLIIGLQKQEGTLLYDDILNVFKSFSAHISTLIKKGYIIMDKEGLTVRPFTEVDTNSIDKNDIYKQYIHILKLADKEGAKAVKAMSNNANFRLQELIRIIDLMLKHYSMLRYKKVKMREDEVKEYELLKVIVDVIKPVTKAKGKHIMNNTLDAYA